MATLPLALVTLMAGLAVPSLALVYLSILLSVAWVPLLVVGLVQLAGSRRASRT